jgi:hypothetical protein
MAHEALLGVMVLARMGDSLTFYQDPQSYEVKPTLLTPLGGMQEYELGKFLRSQYVGGSSGIEGIAGDLVVTDQILARSRHGPEGNAVLDSAVAVLQGLYPPTKSNSMKLANGETVVAPLGGYQNIPIESLDPTEDISLQSWIGCPAFETHISNFYGSSVFKNKEAESADFLAELQPFVYGVSANLKNIWNVYDFVSTQLTHNQTYAFELPPTFLEQTRALVNFHEVGIFGVSDLNNIGSVPTRALLGPTINFLERLAAKKDPLRFVLQEADYQQIISLLHTLEVAPSFPELVGLPNQASALAIEVREGKDSREYLRFKIKNGTDDSGFNTFHVLGHKADIPITEFIYRIENAIIPDKKAWDAACHGKGLEGVSGRWMPRTGAPTLPEKLRTSSFNSFPFALVLFASLFVVNKMVHRIKTRRERQWILREYQNVPQTPEFQEGAQALPAPTTMSEKVRYI